MAPALAFSEMAETLRRGADFRPAARPPAWCPDGGARDGAYNLQPAMSTSALNAGRVDLELMERIEEGDDRALGELYDRHGAVMYTLARSIVSEPADAEEVVADAFLQIWRGAQRYDRGRASVGAFLAVVTRSRALDVVRARRRRNAAEDRAAAWNEGWPAGALSASDPAPDRALELSETYAVVRRALDARCRSPRGRSSCSHISAATARVRSRLDSRSRSVP